LQWIRILTAITAFTPAAQQYILAKDWQVKLPFILLADYGSTVKWNKGFVSTQYYNTK
jgi:hypothetical protein